MSMNMMVMWFSLNVACCAANLAWVAFWGGSHFSSFTAGFNATVAIIYAVDIWEQVA